MLEIIRQAISSLDLLYDIGIIQYAFMAIPVLYLTESIIWRMKGE